VKQIKESKVKYLKALIQKKNGRKIDERALKRRKEYCQIDMDNESLPALNDKYQEAVKEWEDFKKEAKETYEQNLLDLYPTDIAGDSEETRKR